MQDLTPPLEVVVMKKATVLVLILVLVAGATAGVITYYSLGSHPAGASRTHLQRFTSADAFMKAFRNGQKSQYGSGGDGIALKSATPSAAPAAGAGTSEAGAQQHSGTNVQVEGVDEADLVKNDGNYVYAISGNTVFIVAAYPAREARVVSRIDFDRGTAPSEMFIRGDRLVVIGANGYDSSPEPLKEDVPPRRAGTTFIKVFDISNREKPALARTIDYEGSYSTARMIDGNVHVVLASYPYYALYQKKGVKPDDVIPAYRDQAGGAYAGGMAARFAPACDYHQIEVVDPERFTSFLSIVSLSLDGVGGGLNKKVIAGYSDAVYASTGNLYVASADYRYYGGWGAGGGEQATTTVYKFAFDGPRATYLASGRVPGTILNQFSMDESGGFFRIATTRGHVSREGSDSTNNVYVLDPGMKTAGRLEGLAPGEKIYSVRFMGARAYLVTFKKVDPLFVLDLADPGAPRVLGELKIPGYSDYLHPYDETHIIGVGKNTVEAQPEEGGNFAWYQGMKIAIFDVSDVANPREMHKVEIGDRGTDSDALTDHKAFLFDRSKNLLVLPVQLAELTPEQKASAGAKANDYGTFTFQGAYVYDVSLEGGFQLKGRVTHSDPGAGAGNDQERGYGYYGSPDSVRRALYIGDNLYTVSEARIKVNRLDDLSDIATVQLI
jgi:inhibitor of cysteine peptidase